MSVSVQSLRKRLLVPVLLAVLAVGALAGSAAAQAPPAGQLSPTAQANVRDSAGGEANLRVPDLSKVTFRGVDGRTLLMSGLFVCVLGLGFGLWCSCRRSVCRCTRRCSRSPS